MYVIETRYFKDEHIGTTLCIQGDKVVIQRRDEEDVILEEWDFPFYNHGEFLETCVFIDEKKMNFIKKSLFVIINQKSFETHEIKMNFEQGEYVTWDTFVPELTCILCIPHIPDINTVRVTLTISEQYMTIGEYSFRTIKTFFNGSIDMSFLHLQNVFSKHTGKICKLYVSQDSPLCLEFFDGYRIFIAPMCSEVVS